MENITNCLSREIRANINSDFLSYGVFLSMTHDSV